MVARGWSAWLAFTNSNPWTGSTWSPWRTRPRLFAGSRALLAGRDSRGAAAAAPPVPPRSRRRPAGPHPGRPGRPSCGWRRPTVHTCAPAPRGIDPRARARSSGAETLVDTVDVFWASVDAPPPSGEQCPPNRIDEDERRPSSHRGKVRGRPRGHPHGAPRRHAQEDRPMGAYYVGLDVHSRETVFVIQDEAGHVMARGTVPTTTDGLARLCREHRLASGT